MKNVSWGAVGAIAGTVSALAALVALGPAYCNKEEPTTKHIDNDAQGSGQSANNAAVGDGNTGGDHNAVGDHNGVVNGDINAPTAIGKNNKVTVQRTEQLKEQGE